MEPEICTCGHDRGMHSSIFSKFVDGEGPQKGEKDGKCKVDREGVCGCEKYTPEE